MNKKKPLKIQRIRNKSLTTKRRNYKPYRKAKWIWTDIFNELDDLKTKNKKFIKCISSKYGIVYSTLKNKYNHYKNNNISNINQENRGGSNKKINEENEKKIYEYIKKNYIDNENVLNNNIIKAIVNEKYEIKVSNWWVSNFKKRWYLSTQKIKPSKIATNLPSQEEQKSFLDECTEYKNKVRAKFFSIMMKQVIIL